MPPGYPVTRSGGRRRNERRRRRRHTEGGGGCPNMPAKRQKEREQRGPRRSTGGNRSLRNTGGDPTSRTYGDRASEAAKGLPGFVFEYPPGRGNSWHFK